MIEVTRIGNADLNFSESLIGMGGYLLNPAWARLVEKTYGYESYFVTSTENEIVNGVIGISHINHPFFGNYFCTAPYSSYGGIAVTSQSQMEKMLEKIEELAHQHHADFVNLRFVGQDVPLHPIGNWHNAPGYITFRIDLTQPLEKMLLSYSSNHRNHIRKSLKKDLSIRFGRHELLEDAYAGLAISMHELGSPYHAKIYLERMLAELGEEVIFSVIYKDSAIAGAGVFIRNRDTIINLHANVLRKFRSYHAGEYFYWKLIDHFKTAGFSTFDLGRSLIGSGNDIFKSKWEPEQIPCQYWYLVKPGQTDPAMNQKNPKFQLAIRIWKILPGFLVRWLGPYLIRGIA